MRTALATLLILFTATANAAEPPAAVAELVRALEHKDGTKRLHAAAALGELGAKAKAALPALTKALDDSHRIVRFYAAEAIGKVGGKLTPALQARLMKVVKTDESWIVARQAARAVGQGGQASTPVG
jgi:HEAT repeat protein